MGARVTLHSRYGNGSVFRLHLPLAVDAQASVDICRYTPPIGLKSLDGVRVLAIDDNEYVRKALGLILEQAGCDRRVVASIGEALQTVKQWVPDIVVSDYRLQSEQTGGDAIRLLRERLGDKLPAIVVTGDTDPERLREAHSLSALLLHKPISADALTAAIRRLLNTAPLPGMAACNEPVGEAE
jgi:CheY-like chemotaxis protein